MQPPTNKIFIVLLLFFYNSLPAQEIFSWSRETGYCNPSVVGLPRAKALVLKYELQPDYKIRSTGMQGGYGDNTGDINRNRRIDLRLRFPIINKASITIAGGIKYTHEEFRFNNAAASNYGFYKDMEDRPLKSLGLHLYAVRSTRTNKYFIVRASFDLNGDFNSGQIGKSEFLKFSITPMLGWKKSENLSYAVGFSYGYTFGVPLVIPVLSYNYNFNCHWGIESLLPIHARIRYTKNEKNYWYAGMELSGASYRLNNEGTPFAVYDKLHLFRSELRYTLSYERELHDWLWMGLEAGGRHNLRFNLTNGPRSNSDIIIKNRLNESAVFNASIFVVPPRGLLKTRRGTNGR